MRERDKYLLHIHKVQISESKLVWLTYNYISLITAPLTPRYIQPDRTRSSLPKIHSILLFDAGIHVEIRITQNKCALQADCDDEPTLQMLSICQVSY